MGYQDLLQSDEFRGLVAFPWLGGRKIHKQGRTWRVAGRLPREFGWYLFELAAGRTAKLGESCDPAPDIAQDMGWKVTTRGYLVGDRLIPEKARVEPDPDKLIEQTAPVFLVEPGLDRFTPALVAFDEEKRPVFVQQLFGLGPEDAVRQAFVARKPSVADIPGVTPALDLAFRFATRQRELVEVERAELERQRLAAERLEQARRNMGTGAGRRELAVVDFAAAAKAALSLSGAELLDVRESFNRDEMVVQYLFANRRLECTCDRQTLRIIDSGICLTNHVTGEKGDTRFTLESLPGVVQEAINGHKLVVYRHADGDNLRPEDDDDWDD